MAVTYEQLKRLAELSIDGEFHHRSIDQFCKEYPDITEEEGYKGQEIRLQLVEAMGYRRVGYKLGGTSMAKRKQMKTTIYSSEQAVANSSQITYGCLFDYMRLEAGSDLNFQSKLHPKAEAEFAFLMGSDLRGEEVTASDVLCATESVVPAFEIIDSRFHDFKIGSRYDALIDNTSSSAFMLGEGGVDPLKTDLNTIGVKISKNGCYTGFGAGASIMGHPARAVAELVHLLHRAGKGLKKGDIILSGAIAPSIPVQPGDDMQADFGSMGSVRMRVL